MSATFCRVVNGGALVTACKAVTAVSLSANNVGFGAGVTLSWSGAAGGAGNPIRGYEVYRDGVLLTTVFDGTSCTVTSPASNGSYKYTVKALGRIPGFDAPVSAASATLTSIVTAPTAPTSVWLSAADVRIGKSATLSWSGAAGGTNNPVAGYEVHSTVGGDWAYFTTVYGTSLTVTASSTPGQVYQYAVYSFGTVPNTRASLPSGVVKLTAHGAESVISYFASSGTYTVPSWAERVDVSCIGGGASGAGRGWVAGGRPGGGGGGGGSGRITHRYGVSMAPGATMSVTVGGYGVFNNDSYTGQPGGTSSAFGVSAAGGSPGTIGRNGSSSSDQWGASGGNGGDGGNGGGGGEAIYSGDAVDGTGGNGQGSNHNGSVGGTVGSGYVCYLLESPDTARYVGPGGNGQNRSNGGSVAATGTQYGNGGYGDKGSGKAGAVAIRAWRYLS